MRAEGFSRGRMSRDTGLVINTVKSYPRRLELRALQGRLSLSRLEPACFKERFDVLAGLNPASTSAHLCVNGSAEDKRDRGQVRPLPYERWAADVQHLWPLDGRLERRGCARR